MAVVLVLEMLKAQVARVVRAVAETVQELVEQKTKATQAARQVMDLTVAQVKGIPIMLAAVAVAQEQLESLQQVP
jgi:hypothetical protein